MTESRTKCVDCGTTILKRTADRHEGRCKRCQRRASGGPLRGPRPHHYAFAHNHLPGCLWHDPDMLLSALFEASDQFRDDHLRARWEIVGERFPQTDRLSAEGLSGSCHGLADGYRAATITLPPALGPTEAHMVAIVYRGPRRRLWFRKSPAMLRYLTLEYSSDPSTDRPFTVLGEWTPHEHANYGEGPEPDVSAFLNAIGELLTRHDSGSAG